MKKLWNVWLRSLTALTWSMALTRKLKFLPALKIAELAKASPCIRLGAGAFLCYVAPKIPAAEIIARGHYFFI